jgi:hypothetical protein
MHSIQNERDGTFVERVQDTRGIDSALNQARRTALREHAAAGRKVPVWKGGRVVWVRPTLEGDIPPDAPTEETGP